MHFLYILFAIVFGAGLSYFYFASQSRKALELQKNAKAEAEAILEKARKEAEEQKKIKLLEAENEAHKRKIEGERELKQRSIELQKLERRLIQREEHLARKLESVEQKEKRLQEKEQEVARLREELQQIRVQEIQKLESLAGLTADEAKTMLLKNLENELRHEKALLIRKVEQETKQDLENRTREIIVNAIQRYTADHTAEATVSIVPLPNDEMKGRIIGKEGRNVRMLEQLTGIDLIIDDTPETVIISGFDPVRREIARLALEKLILDGRIHPARIEEMVEKARREVEERVREEGEQAVFEAGVHGIHPDLVRVLGRLKYRTSYGQNVLKHSIEVAHLAGLMAAELGLDVALAKRGGLLHDVGKAVTHEVEGSHVEIGVDLARKYKEHPIVINAIGAHHGDIEYTSPISVLVGAADALSAARPGARRESLDVYLKRLERLEQIACSFEGVDKSYAIQAGREIRIIVKPEQVDDAESIRVAKEISKRIEGELDYPGQIKVTVIRETRAVEYAK